MAKKKKKNSAFTQIAKEVERAAYKASGGKGMAKKTSSRRSTRSSAPSRTRNARNAARTVERNYIKNSRLQRNKQSNESKSPLNKKRAAEQYKQFQKQKKNGEIEAKAKKNTAKLRKKDDSDATKIIKGAAKRYAGSQISGIKDTAQDAFNAFLDVLPNGGAVKAGKNALESVYNNTVGKKNKNLRTDKLSQKVDKKLGKVGNKLQKSGQKDIDEAKKGKSSAEKFAIDLGTGLGELGLDVALTRGKGTMAAMYNRAYGSAKQSALDEGASEEQAKVYGKAVGGLEAVTEKMWSVAAPLRKLYGSGAGDELTERVLNKLVSKAGSKAGKNAVYHGGKTFTAALTEGLEEMVSEGLEPTIANMIYANAIGKPHETSAKDILYAGAIGGTVGGLLGGGGQIVEYNRGGKISDNATNIFGGDGVLELIRRGADIDEDTGGNTKAAAYREMIESGNGLANGQVNELYKAVYDQEVRDLQRYDVANRAADGVIQRDGLANIVRTNEETGEVRLSENTQAAYDGRKAEVANFIAQSAELQLPEVGVQQISSSVAAIQTGVAGVDDVNMFTLRNAEARTVYEGITGEKLPDTNRDTKEYLYQKIAQNRVRAAEEETAWWKDTVKGLVQQDVTATYEAAGQEAFSAAAETANPANARQMEDLIVSFEHFYEAGRSGRDYAEISTLGNPAYETVPVDVRRAAYEAGIQDRQSAIDTAVGRQMRIGQTAKESRSMKAQVSHRGRLISELQGEAKKALPASEARIYRMLARTFNIDIHIVEELQSGANGEYHDGVIYLSVNSDRALEYVFAHEITHHMQSYAPEQYEKFKSFVRKRWGEEGGIEEAVSGKIASYKTHGVTLSREEALDEILADSTYEMIQDEEFINELCRENRGIAQAILNAIKDVLAKIRTVLVEGDRFTPRQNEALLSELDVLKDAEKLWTDGLMRAAENRAAVGSVDSRVRLQAAQRVQPFNITRSEILKNMKDVTEMEPVITLDGSGFKKQEGRSLSQAVMDYYGGKEFYVNNPTIGEVKVGKRGIKSSVQHRPIYGTKIEGFKALKEIIAGGEVINASRNYAGKRNDRICVAAPIKIGDDTYYAGVIINRNIDEGMQNYYLHDVITIEKNSLSLKDTEAQHESARMDETVSPYTILQQLNNINNLSEKDVISDEGRFSIPDTDSEGNSLTDAQREYFADVSPLLKDDEGRLKIYHHGTARGDRVGNVFDPERATSGPMAYFTDSAEIAERYSKDKRDTSLEYDEEYDSYETQFRVEIDGESVPVQDLWYSMSRAERNELIEKAKHIVANEDDGSPEVDMSRNSGLGNYDEFLLKEHRGNGIAALVDSWLNGGQLFGEEEVFLDVLKLAGIDDVKYMDPDYREEKVYDVYLNVTNPLDTASVDSEFIDDLRDYVESTDMSAYDKESASADLWDKNDIDIDEWIEGLEDDIENGTTHSWTRIPDIVTDFLKDYMQVDGIVDAGGKNGGETRQVVIPFYSEQIKNIDNENPTDSPDIRFSLKEDDNGTQYTLIDAKDITVEGMSESDSLPKRARAYMKEHFRGAVLPVGKTKSAYMRREAEGEYTNPAKGIDIDMYNDKLLAVTELQNMLKGSRFLRWNNDKGTHKDAVRGWNYYETIFAVMDDDDKAKVYSGEVLIKRIARGDVFYDITKIKEITDGHIGRGVAAHAESTGDSDNNISQDVGKSNTQYSLPDEDSINNYANEHETEFVDVPPVRDYEKRARSVKVQSIGELQEQVRRLRADKRLTYGRILEKKSVKEQMNELVYTLMSYSEGTAKRTNHKLVDMATDNAARIFKAIKTGDYAEASNTAYDTACEIVENLELINDTAFHEYKELRDYLRTTKVEISQEDRSSIPDFDQFRKENMGRMRIVDSGGIPVDTVYEELVERWPGLFGSDVTHPADRLIRMAEIRESLEPYDVMLSEEMTEQLIKQTAQDILDISATGRPWKSFADRKKEAYDNMVKTMKARQREAVRDVRNRERERATRMVNVEKRKASVKAQKQKMRKEHVERFGSIHKNYKWLSDRLLRPTDDKHIPEEFKISLAHLLQHFDFQTERSKKLEKKYGKAQKTLKMEQLRREYEKLAKEDGAGPFVYDGYIFELMDALCKKLEGKTIDQAANEDLRSIDTILKAIVHNIRNYNKAFSENIKENVAAVGNEILTETQKYVDQRGAYKKGGVLKEGRRKLLDESMLKPREFFEELGSGMSKMYMGLRKGFDKHIDNLTEARKFFDEIFKPYNRKGKPGSKIEEWRDGRSLQTYALQDGGHIELSKAQVMSLYCLRKREQAMGHITGSGVCTTDVDAKSRMGRLFGKTALTANPVPKRLSVEDVDKIISSLSAKQVAMAERLMGFINTRCTEWGNDVSMKVYGYKKFTEKNYFPIHSAAEYLDKNFDSDGAKGGQNRKDIKNPGFSKATEPNANNPLVIDDIFSVVAEHINEMSMYNAFAAPMYDFTRVYNYKARGEDGNLEGSVQQALTLAYGQKVNRYISTFMADINGMAAMRSDAVGDMLNKSLANYKKASMGFNLRVALQQPTAVVRTAVLMNPTYFLGKNHAPILATKKDLEDMKAHCQVARWKSWGFSDVDMARGMDEIMMNKEWSKLDVVTMQLYSALDMYTWSKIWGAVRAEVKHKHKDVKVDSEEFYRLCNERASEIFDKTQVVDSVFHRSQAMRRKDVGSKLLTSFMSEPTTTFNMVRSELVKANELRKDGHMGRAILKANRAISVYVIQAAAVSAAAAVADALRGKAPDDDDEEDTSWFTNFVFNFWDNANPLNMIPFVKDVWGFKDGWGSQNMALEGWDSLVQSTWNLYSIFTGESDKSLEEAGKEFAEGLGLVFGIPVKNVFREVGVAFKAFGIDVFAAEEGDESDKGGKNWLEKLIDSAKAELGFNVSDGEDIGPSGYSRDDKDYYGIYAQSEGGLLDRIMDKSKKEIRQEAFNDRVEDIKGDIEGLEGRERDDAIWDAVTKNYTKYVADCEFDVLKEMRKTLKAVGGDVEKFDEKVLGKVKSEYKKSIGDGGDWSKMFQYKQYLMDKYEYSEAKISNELVKSSNTAKEFQEALCLNDENTAVFKLGQLIDAGITYEDAYVLYVDRFDAVDPEDYAAGEFIFPATGNITSSFGYRESPGGIGSKDHKGIDIGAEYGSDVIAVDGGQVTKVEYNRSRGQYIEIKHGNGRITRYQHLSGSYVRKGDVITAGQLIGAVGSSGASTGPHLHFEVQENGTYIDPMIYFQ